MRAGRPRATRAAGLALLVAVAASAGCAAHAGKQAASGLATSIRESQASTRPEDQIARVASTRAVEGALAALEQPEQRAQFQRIVDLAVTRAVASALRAALAPDAAAGAADGTGGGRGAAALLAGQIGRAATEDALTRVAWALGSDGPLGRGLVTTSTRATDAAVGTALGRVAFALGGDQPLGRGVVTTSARATDAAVGAALAELFPECRGDDAAAAACRRDRVQALTRATAASVTAGVRDSLRWPLLAVFLFLAAAVGLALGALVHWALGERRRRPRAFRPA
jgi:hypothetical protein